jgi:hypothetical protein
MFSDAYRGAKYFGQWAEETADAYGRRDALAVLQDAAERRTDEDMRTGQVLAALSFLSASATRQGAFRAFRVGLDLLDPLERSRAVYSFILRHPWVKPKIGTIKKATGFYRACSS